MDPNLNQLISAAKDAANKVEDTAQKTPPSPQEVAGAAKVPIKKFNINRSVTDIC